MHCTPKKKAKRSKSDDLIESINALAKAQAEQWKMFMAEEKEREKREKLDEQKRLEEERAHELKIMAMIMQSPQGSHDPRPQQQQMYAQQQIDVNHQAQYANPGYPEMLRNLQNCKTADHKIETDMQHVTCV